MSRKVELPEEVVAELGDDPEREALEALLLHLIRADRASVAWAGERLGLHRQEAIRWYTSHGYPFPDYTEKEIEEDFRHASALFGDRGGTVEPEKRAEKQAKLEEAVVDLQATLAQLREETGMTEDELVDLFDLNKPFPNEQPASREALAGVVTRDPDVAGGEPVFVGTTVSVRDLIEHLKGGDPLNDFTGHSNIAVTREQTVAFLEWSLAAVREAIT